MKRLSLDQLSSIAAIASAIAVIVSLVYVAIELNQNTAAVKADALRSIMAASEGTLLAIAQDGELADMLTRAQRNPAGLTEGERLRLFYFQLYNWRTLASARAQHELGLLGDEQWDLIRRLGCRPMSPGQRAIWPRHKELLPSEFVRFVEGCGALAPYEPETASLPEGARRLLPGLAGTDTSPAIAGACRTLGGELEPPQADSPVAEASCRFPDGSGRSCDANGDCAALQAAGPASDAVRPAPAVAGCGPCRQSCMERCSAERPLPAMGACVLECVENRCHGQCGG